jgi:peptide/nickel transport system substrate-binding protein
VNRQSRALLTILIVASIGVPYWFFSQRELTRERPGAVRAMRGGSAIATTRTDPRSFNRLMQPDIATDLFAMLTLGRLVRVNRSTHDLEPWLAEKWEMAVDQRTFTITLRDGVTWSDGTPFTSADVVFSFAAAYDARAKTPAASALRIDGQPLEVSAPDARTVVVTYPAIFGPGIRLLDNLYILPKHKLEGALQAGTFAAAWGANTPPAELVSIGPFVLKQYQPAQRLVYERNERYWRQDEAGVRLPYLDRLTLEILPDQEAELVRLQTGEADFTQDPIRASDLETLRPLELQGRLQVHELGVSPAADALVFNLRPQRWEKDARAEWLTRREFRQALSHAVDREAFADTVFLGAAVPIHGPVTPGNRRWFWPSVPRYEFSRDRAKALFEQLGLRNRDDDEWLEDASGAEARFTLLVFRGNPVLERSAAVLRDDFRQVGIAVDVVPLESSAVRTRVLGGDFDAALVRFAATDLDPAISRDFWVSSGASRFWNPGQKVPATEWERRVDELMAQQTATTDEDERKRLFNEVQRIFAENLPMLYFAAPRVYVATSARLINVAPALVPPVLSWSADTLAVRDAATATR